MALDQHWRGYHDGNTGLKEYLSYLSRLANNDSFPNIALFRKTADLEKKLDFANAERERNQFLSHLVEKLSKPQLDQLTADSAALRSGDIAYPDYYRSLKNAAREAGVALSMTPEFDRYVTYVLEADAIKSETLFSELSQLENKIWENLSQTTQQKNLVRASLQVSLTEKLVRLTLTPQEWNDYKTVYRPWSIDHRPNFSPFEKFYAAAEARNHALAANFTKKLVESPSKLAVLVAGGFHSAGLTQLLKEPNVTLITVSPKLSTVNGFSDNAYLNVFTRERTPLEQLFESPKISVVMTPVTNPIEPGVGAPSLNPSQQLFRAAIDPLATVAEQVMRSGLGSSNNESLLVTGAAAGHVSTLASPTRVPDLFDRTNSGTSYKIWATALSAATAFVILRAVGIAVDRQLAIAFVVGAVVLWMTLPMAAVPPVNPEDHYDQETQAMNKKFSAAIREFTARDWYIPENGQIVQGLLYALGEISLDDLPITYRASQVLSMFFSGGLRYATDDSLKALFNHFAAERFAHRLLFPHLLALWKTQAMMQGVLLSESGKLYLADFLGNPPA